MMDTVGDDDVINCLICTELVVGAVRTNCCKHIFCSACITVWLTKGSNDVHSCPNCRAMIGKDSLVPDGVIDAKSASVLRSCPQKEEFDCPFEGTRDEVENHKKACQLHHQLLRLPSMVDKMANGTMPEKDTNVKAVSAYLKDYSHLHSHVLDAGALPVLLSLLREDVPEVVSTTLLCLEYLGHDASVRNLIFEAGVAEPLVHVISSSEVPATQEKAMLFVSKLVIFNPTRQNAFVECGAVLVLLRCLRSANNGVALHAAGGIWNLAARNVDVQILVAEAGVFPLLINILNSAAMTNAIGALWNILASNDAHNNIVISHPRVLTKLIDVLREGTDGAKEWTASALETLTSSNKDNIPMIVECDAVAPLAALLQSKHALSVHFALSVLTRMIQYHPPALIIVAAQLAVVSSLLDILVRTETENPEVLKSNAVQLLHLLAEGDADMPSKIVQEAGVKALVSVLRTLTPDSKIVPPVLKLLEYLARTSADVRAALECIPDAPRAIVQVAFSSDSVSVEGDATIECACSLLCLMVADNVESQNNLAQSGALKQLLSLFTKDQLPTGPAAVWKLIHALVDNSPCREIIMTYVGKSSDISYTGAYLWG